MLIIASWVALALNVHVTREASMSDAAGEVRPLLVVTNVYIWVKS